EAERARQPEADPRSVQRGPPHVPDHPVGGRRGQPDRPCRAQERWLGGVSPRQAGSPAARRRQRADPDRQPDATAERAADARTRRRGQHARQRVERLRSRSAAAGHGRVRVRRWAASRGRARESDRHHDPAVQRRRLTGRDRYAPVGPMNRILRTGLAVALAAVGSGGPVAAKPPSVAVAITPTTVSSSPSIARLVGQKLVVRMEGTTPSADLLGRIQRGEVGGVILFGANITTATALRALTARLQGAATAGNRPRLLIAVDQEGGSVKRIPWIPPTLSPPQMGQLGSTTIARSQGSATGLALHDLGIDVDFAPVADVPSSTAS